VSKGGKEFFSLRQKVRKGDIEEKRKEQKERIRSKKREDTDFTASRGGDNKGKREQTPLSKRASKSFHWSIMF